MVRYLGIAASAAGLIFALIPAAGHAQPTVDAISAPPTLAAWSQRVFRDLSRQMRDPVEARSEVMPTGIVAVKFGCSESGAPSSVQLYKTSGNRRLDRAAMRAVSKIATLHPLPARLRHEQQYIVRVLFANSGSGAEREIRKMQAEAVKSNAWYNQGATSTAAIELVPVG